MAAANRCIKEMHNDSLFRFGRSGVLDVKCAFPGNRVTITAMSYTDLDATTEGGRTEYHYKTRQGRTRIYVVRWSRMYAKLLLVVL